MASNTGALPVEEIQRARHAESSMRIAFAPVCVLVACGCATTHYTSLKPAPEVAQCIASGWRTVPGSGVEVPVSLTTTDEYHVVDVVLVRDFPTFLPIHSIWAKIRPGKPDSALGSSTEYRRNFQITHARIDRVVEQCQE